MIVKEKIKKIRSKVNFWINQYDVNFLHELRLFELKQIRPLLPKKGNILEIGAGTGFQSKILKSWNYDVKSIDLNSSIYKDQKTFDVTSYDGKNIPFKDSTFSIVFSSNVFEHIVDIKNMLNEIARVTKQEAIILLIMPSPSWRIWSFLTDLLKNWYSRPHGVHTKNVFEEIFCFSKKWWIKKLKHESFKVEMIKSNNLFYTGNSIMGNKFPIKYRRKLSFLVGSSCNIYVLKKIL